MSSPLSYFTSLPPITRTFLASTFLLSLSSFLLRSIIAPHNVSPLWTALGVHINYDQGVQIPWIELQVAGLYWRPWNLLTCAFMERGFISLAFTLFFQAVYGNRLESAWGGREFANFVLIVLLASRTFLVVLTFLWSFISSDSESLLYYTSTYGFGPAQLAFLIADCQLRPNSHLQTFIPSIKLPVRLLPLLSLIFPLLQLLTGNWTPSLFTTFIEFWFSWAYLRFYIPSNESRGDRSPDWAFSEWFWWNGTLQRGVAFLGDQLWDSVGTKIGLGEMSGGGVSSTGRSVETGGSALPSSTSTWAGFGTGNTLGAAPAERTEETSSAKVVRPSDMVEVVVVKQ